MVKKIYRVRNWNNYNRSLVQRGSLTFWFSTDVVKNWTGKKCSDAHGNCKYSDIAIICGLTLRQLFRLPLRATEGLMRSLIKLMKLAVTAPDYTTLCRRGKTVTIHL